MVGTLIARGLVHEYAAGVRALDGVDVDLAPRELVVGIGPNGSGKSTLVRCLAGLIEPTRGDVRVEGRPLAELSTRERARAIAVVPQYLPKLPDARVDDFVLGGRYAHLGRWRSASAHDRERVDVALAQCDCSDVAKRLLNELSGGQRQRVLVARAVAQEARALLVDEPTNSLDPEHQLAVFQLLASLAAEGKAAFVVTHDLNLASQFATRIVLLQRGRVVADGDVESVLRREVLEPVYGPNLHYGRLPAGAGGAARPFVLPIDRRTLGATR